MNTITVKTTIGELQRAYSCGENWYATPTSESGDYIAEIYCEDHKRFRHDFLAIPWEQWESVVGYDIDGSVDGPDDDDEISLEIPRDRSLLDEIEA